MPTLAVMDNPCAVFPDGVLIPELHGTWAVWQTIHRREKAVASALVEREVSYYLPMYLNKKTGALVPLIQSFIFVCGEVEGVEEARRTHWIHRHLLGKIEVRNQKRLVKDLLNLQHAIEAGGSFLDPFPGLVVGRRCQITHGPFEGVEGILIERDGDTRFVLQVQMLGRAVPLEISDPDWIEPIEESN